MQNGNRLTRLQKCALGTLISLLALIYVGAVVRVTGAGLGCPDWPLCWGKWIPPTSVEQVDFESLDLERFRKKAERLGHPGAAALTEASLREAFNAVHVWTEYINRLFSIPVGIFSLATFLVALAQWRRWPFLVFCAAGVVLLVGLNAWLGMRVVYSGLKPGVITLHMALAVFLLGVLTYIAWRATDRPWRVPLKKGSGKNVRSLLSILLVLTVIEGVLGSQVREKTDALALLYDHAPRSAWTDQLEHSWMYLVHRSFSWLVFIAAVGFYLLAGRRLEHGNGWLEKAILGLVLAQMVLGLVLAHIGILQVVQVLHIGLSSLLVCALCLWWLGCRPDLPRKPLG